jgi:hypothetical protein
MCGDPEPAEPVCQGRAALWDASTTSSHFSVLPVGEAMVDVVCSTPQVDGPGSVVRTTAAGFPEGAAITTDDTIYFGFGFEGIASPGTRSAVMGRAMTYLLR